MHAESSFYGIKFQIISLHPLEMLATHDLNPDLHLFPPFICFRSLGGFQIAFKSFQA